MILSITRVARLALQQFHRNLWLSIATIMLLVLPLLAINVIISLGAVADAATHAVQDKIDVSVYFKASVGDDIVESVQEVVKGLPEVKETILVGREASLARFKERHVDDPVIAESLKELGDNPFGATLVVKAKNPTQYQRILTFFSDPKYADLIEEKNFDDHRFVIDKINTLMRNIRSFGLAVAAIFGAIAVLIVINTVRVAVYTHRAEIGVMRLVGAGNWFIRGPFLVEAFLFSFTAMMLTAAIVYPSLLFIQPRLTTLFEGINLSLIAYYNEHLIKIFGIQLLAVFVLTVLSSFFAVRRYLRT